MGMVQNKEGLQIVEKNWLSWLLSLSDLILEKFLFWMKPPETTDSHADVEAYVCVCVSL